MDNFSEDHLRIFEKEKIDCGDFEDLLDDFQDQELPDSLRSRLQSHKDTCRTCQEADLSYRLIRETARSIRDVPVPQETRLKLRNALKKLEFIQ